MSDIARALSSLAPSKRWALVATPEESDEDQYAALEWRDDGDPPSLAELQAKAAELEIETCTEAVNVLRDTKIADGFIFGGVLFQTDLVSVKRIAGAASAAHVAITQDGAAAGDLRWADPDSDFEWIAADNSVVAMDAPTVVAFGQAYMAFERELVFAASAIKARIRAGETVSIETAPEWP